MQKIKINLGIIGCGRWGINHVKTAYNLLGENLTGVFDSNPKASAKVSEISQSIPFTTNKNDVIKNSDINGVIIATPAETHFELAKECLENGKHVLVEKPITLKSDEAKILVELAKSKNLQIMAGHVLLYHPAIRMIKKYVSEKIIGNLQYIYSNRLNLGAIRSEENILWSFAPHDISIIQHLTETNPIEVSSHGANFVQNGIEDTTITYLKYPNNVHAHIFVSWLHPFKEQRLVVIGDKGMMVFEDSLAKDKLKFYPKGFEKTDKGIQKFEGDFESVQFGEAQPLAEEHKHFYDCIINNKQPLTDGTHALEVLEILEQASERLKL
ncbi:MAG: Gfo/Idh/MocA family oxidoreductase [bacterium]|nr:Gfo/Idh/MocA family oxidoreductase [bacterium]